MKKTCGMMAAILAVLVVGASTASAQDTPKAGITFSSGSAIGVYIPMGDAAALRPQVGFSRSTTDYEGANFVTGEVTSTTWTAGAAVLFYVKSWDATRLYVSPQYSFARSTSSRDSDSPSTGHSASAMIGAQHTFGPRFAVYTEGGLSWSRSKNSGSSALSESSITTTGIHSRAAVGGIIFF